MRTRRALIGIVMLASVPNAGAQLLGTAFTYQGRLVDGGGAANGTYDLQFGLFDSAVDGSQVAPIVTKDDVEVTSGVFAVTLDFGGVFGGNKRFLEVGVRAGSSTGAYTVLSPRQELTPAPHAIFSANAATVGGLSCTNGQVAKWSDGVWTCGGDADSGGDITAVTAGTGLTGGGTTGPVTINVGSGTGVVVAADTVSLDTAFTDTRYVNTSGDTLAGTLDMNQFRILNRACPAGYLRVGPGLCVEDVDAGGLAFTACANRCRVAGTHMCSSAEIRGVMSSGVPVGNGGVIGDWIDAQDTASTALVINSNSDTNAMISVATTNTAFCRCCVNVE